MNIFYQQLVKKIFTTMSFIAFLFLYVIQDARIDFLIRGKDINTELTLYVVSLLIIIVGWITICIKQKNATGCIQWKALDVVLLTFVFSLLITRCFYSDCHIIEVLKRKHGAVSTLLILEGCALLAMPSLIYFLSWMREESKDRLIVSIDSFIQKKKFFYICVFLALVAISLMVYFSFSPTLWGDEAFTVGLIEHSYTEITYGTAKDVHPPLYYYITKLVADVLVRCFPSIPLIYAARLGSTIPYILMVVICITCIRRYWGYYVSGLGALALVAMPYMLNYGVDIRMYGWSMLWVTCCWLSAYNIIIHNRKRDWILLVLSGLAAAYTHYFACVAASLSYIILGIWCIRCGKAHILRWLLAAVVTVIGYLPWLVIFIHQLSRVSHHWWPKAHKWVSPAETSITLILMQLFDNILVYLAFIGILVAAFYQFRQKRDLTAKYALSGMILPVFILVIGFSFSVMQTVLNSRYLIPTAGALWLGCILAAKTTNSRILLTLVMLSTAIGNMTHFSYEQIEKKACAAEFLNHIKDDKKNVVFVIPEPSVRGAVFSMLTQKRSYICNDKKGFLSNGSPFFAAWKQLISPLGKSESVRGLLTDDNVVYFVQIDNSSEKIIKKTAREENLSLTDKKEYKVGQMSFFMYRIEKLEIKKIAEILVENLSLMRFDIQNRGTAENSIFLNAPGAKVIQPEWFNKGKGIGHVVESAALKQRLNITIVKNGVLHLDFRGSDKRYDGKRFPLMVDYKSIKVDGTEILNELIATWHDKPFRYKMPVKDGQKVIIEVEQTPHLYSREELKDIIDKLDSNHNYTPEVLTEIANEVYIKIAQLQNESSK